MSWCGSIRCKTTGGPLSLFSSSARFSLLLRSSGLGCCFFCLCGVLAFTSFFNFHFHHDSADIHTSSPSRTGGGSRRRTVRRALGLAIVPLSGRRGAGVNRQDKTRGRGRTSRPSLEALGSLVCSFRLRLCVVAGGCVNTRERDCAMRVLGPRPRP